MKYTIGEKRKKNGAGKEMWHSPFKAQVQYTVLIV